MRQDAAKRRAQVRVAAKFTGGGKTNQDRQNDKRRRTAHVEHDVDRVIGIHPTVGFYHSQQAHQQARCDDGRNDRHENIRQQTRDTLERIQLTRRDVGGFRLGGFAYASGLNEGRIDFIDHAGAENNLHLPRVAKTPFDPVNLANRLLVGQRIINQDQA
ncbi:hypothetical protein D3C80_915670 [compost metagenome]